MLLQGTPATAKVLLDISAGAGSAADGISLDFVLQIGEKLKGKAKSGIGAAFEQNDVFFPGKSSHKKRPSIEVESPPRGKLRLPEKNDARHLCRVGRVEKAEDAFGRLCIISTASRTAVPQQNMVLFAVSTASSTEMFSL